MSDTSLNRGHHRHSHGHHKFEKQRRSSDKDKLLHHNHYRGGSVLSSYTAVNNPTTPFRPCHPKHGGKKDNKRIELIIKQGIPSPQPTVYNPQNSYIQPVPYQPQVQYDGCTTAPLVQQPVTYAMAGGYEQRDIIYQPAPPARHYEFYRNEEPKRVSFNNDRQVLNTVSTQIKPKEFLTQGTGSSMATLETKIVSDGTAMGPSLAVFEKNKEAVTIGTGSSMVLDPKEPESIRTRPMGRAIVMKRPMFTDKIVKLDPSTSEVLQNSEPSVAVTVYDEVQYPETETEIKDPELCPLCHKGWYVRKFTWSGIVSAIFCFPCGIYACFKMRNYVCSFCGEQPVAEYSKYSEKDMEKTEGQDDSRSRIIPPQNITQWRSTDEKQQKVHDLPPTKNLPPEASESPKEDKIIIK